MKVIFSLFLYTWSATFFGISKKNAFSNSDYFERRLTKVSFSYTSSPVGAQCTPSTLLGFTLQNTWLYEKHNSRDVQQIACTWPCVKWCCKTEVVTGHMWSLSKGDLHDKEGRRVVGWVGQIFPKYMMTFVNIIKFLSLWTLWTLWPRKNQLMCKSLCSQKYL